MFVDRSSISRLLARRCSKTRYVFLMCLLNSQIKLDPNWNNIDEDEAIYLASSLQNLKELDLYGENIEPQGIRALSAAIKHMENPVKF